jgi:hypothetical protein
MTIGVNNVVYLLWFVQQSNEEEDTELLIGVYSSEADAKAATARLKERPGFIKFQEGFQIHEYELGRDHWTEGFVRR